MIEIEVYETPSGERPFEKWFEKIERQAQQRVRVAIARLEEGNTGSPKSVGGGVWELKSRSAPDTVSTLAGPETAL